MCWSTIVRPSHTCTHIAPTATWLERGYLLVHMYTMENNTENMTNFTDFLWLICVVLVIEGPLTFLEFLFMCWLWLCGVMRMIILHVHNFCHAQGTFLVHLLGPGTAGRVLYFCSCTSTNIGTQSCVLCAWTTVPCSSRVKIIVFETNCIVWVPRKGPMCWI